MFGKRHDGRLPFVRHRPVTNPILPVADMAEAIAFYTALGFEVVDWDENYAWVKHCGHEWFHLRLVDDVAGNHTSAYLHVADADEWRAAMTANADGSIEMTEVAVMPWGKREFSLVDPAGNLLRLGSPA